MPFVLSNEFYNQKMGAILDLGTLMQKVRGNFIDGQWGSTYPQTLLYASPPQDKSYQYFFGSQ